MNQEELKIITRKEAKEQGLKHYFTGKPCVNGHICIRFVSGTCKECGAEHTRLRRVQNEKYLINSKNKQNSIQCRTDALEKGLTKFFTGIPCIRGHIDFRSTSNGNCYECNRQKSRENRDIFTQYSVKYRNTPKGKATVERYKITGAPRKRATKARRRAREIDAYPSWASFEKILDIYLNCPNGYEVDHIIPLQGKLVCGLHVENNLQYLTRKENTSKGNRFIPFILTFEEMIQTVTDIF
jgi:hypothetical protein